MTTPQTSKPSAIEIEMPTGEAIRITNLICDFNGTLALDGKILDGIQERIKTLAVFLKVHVLTSDTFGTVKNELQGWPVEIKVVRSRKEKLDFINAIGPNEVAAIGNGKNDIDLLRSAKIGVAVLGEEGLAVDALNAADVCVFHPKHALDLLLNPLRLAATLRQ